MKPQSYYRNTREEMLPFLPQSARRVLDVGCATGVFGANLKQKRNLEVWGIDPHGSSVEEATKVLDRAIHGTFGEDAGLPRGYFDVICFNDVLEHMVDPVIELRYAASLLPPQGCVVASIPNFRHIRTFWNLIVHRWAQYENAGIMDRTHLRIFTKSSIEILFEESGFSIDSIQGINGQFITYQFYILNILTLGRSSDTRWLQYAVVARPRPAAADNPA